MKTQLKKGKWFVLLLLLTVLTACSNNENSSSSESRSATSQESVSESSSDQDLTLRETAFGKVKGKVEDDTLVWLGIPYGGDTSGENRYQAPRDPESWEDTLDVSEAGEVALQPQGEEIIGSENALNLDIYRPNSEKENLPVLVYIHGGNNQTGKASEISGVSFVQSHDAIVVSVDYRLGALGFNPLPALKDGSIEENSGNYALLDLKKSLDWIEANIANFGGDSENITVAGFSAGGRDVMAMLISPMFEGTFDKAISFSGGMTIADEAKSQEVFAEAIAPLVVEDGIKKDEAAAKEWLLTDDSEVKDYLVQIDGDRLVALMGNASIRMSVFPHLYNDGYVIPKEGFDTDSYNSVPLLMLTGEQEFSLFGRFSPYFSEYVADGTIDTNPEISSQYTFINKYGGQLYSLFNVNDSAAKMHENYDAPIYGMEILFGEDAGVVGKDMAKLGSFHGVFVPLLDTHSQNYAPFVGDAYESKGAKALSAMFQDYLFEFISNGDPNGDGLTEWTEWQADAEQNLLFIDATKEEATAQMGKKEFDYAQVLNDLAADTTVSEDLKNDLITQVLNGRWFSYELDKKYDNLSAFEQKN